MDSVIFQDNELQENFDSYYIGDDYTFAVTENDRTIFVLKNLDSGDYETCDTLRKTGDNEYTSKFSQKAYNLEKWEDIVDIY